MFSKTIDKVNRIADERTAERAALDQPCIRNVPLKTVNVVVSHKIYGGPVTVTVLDGVFLQDVKRAVYRAIGGLSADKDIFFVEHDKCGNYRQLLESRIDGPTEIWTLGSPLAEPLPPEMCPGPDARMDSFALPVDRGHAHTFRVPELRYGDTLSFRAEGWHSSQKPLGAESNSFVVELQDSDNNIVMQWGARHDRQCIVRNSCINGSWGRPQSQAVEEKVGGWPHHGPNDPLHVDFTWTKLNWQVCINGVRQPAFDYAHRCYNARGTAADTISIEVSSNVIKPSIHVLRPALDDTVQHYEEPRPDATHDAVDDILRLAAVHNYHGVRAAPAPRSAVQQESSAKLSGPALSDNAGYKKAPTPRVALLQEVGPHGGEPGAPSVHATVQQELSPRLESVTLDDNERDSATPRPGADVQDRSRANLLRPDGDDMASPHPADHAQEPPAKFLGPVLENSNEVNSTALPCADFQEEPTGTRMRSACDGNEGDHVASSSRSSSQTAKADSQSASEESRPPLQRTTNSDGEGAARAAAAFATAVRTPIAYKVVHSTAVPVVELPNHTALQVGTLSPGDVVHGIPGGAWLRLVGKEGPMERGWVCCEFVTTRLMPEWAQMQVVNRPVQDRPCLILRWPGLEFAESYSLLCRKATAVLEEGAICHNMVLPATRGCEPFVALDRLPPEYWPFQIRLSAHIPYANGLYVCLNGPWCNFEEATEEAG